MGVIKHATKQFVVKNEITSMPTTKLRSSINGVPKYFYKHKSCAKRAQFAQLFPKVGDRLYAVPAFNISPEPIKSQHLYLFPSHEGRCGVLTKFRIELRTKHRTQRKKV